MGKDRLGSVRSALDHALETVAGITNLAGRVPSIDDARLAVKASDLGVWAADALTPG